MLWTSDSAASLHWAVTEQVKEVAIPRPPFSNSSAPARYSDSEILLFQRSLELTCSLC